jgi:hypothetical protein
MTTNPSARSRTIWTSSRAHSSRGQYHSSPGQGRGLVVVMMMLVMLLLLLLLMMMMQGAGDD